jgi:signal transduction histidine kinase
MLDRNEAAFVRERRFVADASHELRAPLAILKTELELALTGEHPKRELRDALLSADAEADRVAQLARDLLTLAQVDAGELPIEPARLELSELAERVRQRFVTRARAEGRALLAEVPDGMTVCADPLRAEQALSNLVENALRHGAGTVTLSAACHDGTVELHVTDGGPGFPEDFLAVAFERFSRPDAGRSVEGTGLGLSIVRSIARAHGGEAHVRNRPGGGADAWITLPVGAGRAAWEGRGGSAQAEAGATDRSRSLSRVPLG